MSATQDLIAAALTAADELEGQWQRKGWKPLKQAETNLREMCARAMVQPDMGEVKNLVSAACNLMFDAGKLLGRRDAGADREVEDARSARTALLDYVRGVMAERDALIHDNERSIYGDTREAAGYARGLAEERERCAVKAWMHYMDTCKRNGIGPDVYPQWCCAAALREEVKP